MQHLVNFVSIYASYVSLYFCRKNYATFLPLLSTNYDLELTESSKLGSSFEFFYGIFKLIAGPLADNVSNPKYLLCFSVFGSAIVNVLMFSSGSFGADTLLWSCNSFFQALGWPALSAIFMLTFHDSPNRGSLYTLLSTSQNIGSAITPFMLQLLLNESFSWRSTVQFPGIIGVCVGFGILIFVHTKQRKTSGVTLKETFARYRANLYDLATNRSILFLSLSYIFGTFVRVSTADWSFVYLKNISTNSSSVMASFEAGGFIGGLAIGILSDKVFHGQRKQVMALFMCLASIPVYFIYSNLQISVDILYFLLGLFTFGPHVLTGLLAREIFPTSPNTAGSFVKFIAQIGGVLAGYPLSLVISNISLGWHYVGLICSFSCMAGAFCILNVSEGTKILQMEEEKKVN